MIEVLIPWRGGCPHRRAALEWVLDRWERRGEHPKLAEQADRDAPWVKARAVRPLIESSEADIVVVSDADVWAPWVGKAIEAVRGGASWAVPYRLVHRLTPADTDRVLAGAEPDLSWRADQHPYLGTPGGGIVVARREVLVEVPLDPRIEGWGREDICWGIALTKLFGSPWRPRGMEAPLWHLWHPPQAEAPQWHLPPRERDELHGFGSHESKALWRRYVEAKKNGKQAMRELIEEVR